MNYHTDSDVSTRQFGERVGRALRGGELLELVGDVGAGKTTFVKGLALGLEIDDTVQSPTFTISRVYQARDDLELAHYDFYRLTEPGIMSMEIAEVITDPRSIVVIEWGGIIQGVLPNNRLTIEISSESESERRFSLIAHGDKAERLLEELE